MKQRYYLVEDLYFNNKNKKSHNGYNIFELQSDFNGETKSFGECFFEDEEHMLHFIHTLNHDKSGKPTPD
jgi:hypothetical protein